MLRKAGANARGAFGGWMVEVFRLREDKKGGLVCCGLVCPDGASNGKRCLVVIWLRGLKKHK